MAAHELTRFKWERLVVSPHGPASSTTRLVLLVMATFADRQLHAYPSIKTLAAAAGLSERAVVPHVTAAAAEGWIVKQSVRSEGKEWRRSVYRLSMPPHVQGDARPSSPSPPHGGERPSSPTEPEGGPDAQPTHGDALGADGDASGALGDESGGGLVMKDVPTINVMNNEDHYKQQQRDRFSIEITRTAEQLGLTRSEGEGIAAWSIRVAAAKARHSTAGAS